MKVIDREVFIVGYRKTNNDEWKTSGKTYGNLTDAQTTAKAVTSQTGSLTKVFTYGRAQPV
ncbi:MAG: hypothetical protein ABF709_05140 [Leuconostoc pseudomesenteroides]|uniref:hypothetical protein n=1 Tax=Leuconostoc pseudomesenteroides TaxID=33968 RepID=UPI001E29FE96|nr:hypothetical protein [Leuconostoc pseudomesenteroides]MCC7668897.1 hypothetical protein [Leuconostoc pseudomesenteroides]